MYDPLYYRARYQQLKTTRPSIAGAGIWFSLVWLMARLSFFAAALLFVLSLLWVLKVVDVKMIDEQAGNYLDKEGTKEAAVFFCFFWMITCGFAARMAKRVVRRNVYIAELEMLVEEMVGESGR